MVKFISLCSFFVIYCVSLSTSQVETQNIVATQNDDVSFLQTIQKREAHIFPTQERMTIDGNLNELTWQNSNTIEPFIQSIPYDTSLAESHTEVKICFDTKNIYIAAKCFQNKNKYTVFSLKRDFQSGTSDLFGVLIDPFSDKQNAFSFAVNPYGAQREGLISTGNDFTTDWDNKWYSEVKNYEDYFIVEMAIPFKSLRYKTSPNKNIWNIQFLRFDQSQKKPERSNWFPLPRYANGANIAFTGKLIWEAAPPDAGTNIAFIPYALGGVSNDYLSKSPTTTERGVGFDAKIAVSSALNLDVTVNPDFAQVDADKQQINLSRFELFFPERRQFFLENRDLFGSFGFDNINPFFSRRLGLAKDTSGNLIKVPILSGIRLTGKVNNNLRIGVMDVQTLGDEKNKIPNVNFLNVAVQQKLFARSNIAITFLNKQNFGFNANKSPNWEINNGSYNRVAGLEYNMFSKSGLWEGKVFYHQAITPTQLPQSFSTAARLIYGGQNFNAYNSFEYVGNNYDAQMGYIQRTNYFRTTPNANYIIYPKESKINNISFGFDSDFIWRNDDARSTDWNISPLVFGVNFQSLTRLTFIPLHIDYTYLLNNFDPTNIGGVPLASGTDYTYKSTRLNFISDTRKHFYYSFTAAYGEYFKGKIASLQSQIAYRWQPYGVFSIDANLSRISLPSPYETATLVLISPKIDLSFSRSVFLTTFVQYNNQINNLNLNVRLQWRYAPVSDVFLVYTDNYFATSDIPNNYAAFQVKNRGVVLKCNYWFNL